jgi:hypothetical protein
MKFSGTSTELFAAVRESAGRFQGVGRSGISTRLAPSGTIALAAGMAAGSVMATRLQDKRLARIVRREIKKTIQARQPKGLSFDLFG